VGGLLADKSLHLTLEQGLFVGWQDLQAMAHRVNEKLFADRETHRKGVEPGREEGIVRAPMALHGLFQVDQEAADNELSHGGNWFGTTSYQRTLPCARGDVKSLS